MEVSIANTDSLPKGSLISVRFGGVRRQAPLDKLKSSTLKFPHSADDCADPLKIEVLQPIGGARLVLQRKEATYKVELGSKGEKEMNIGVQVKHCPSAASASSPAHLKPALPVKYQDAAVSAREYLEQHGVLRYIQGLLHTIIQVRPKDPFFFMIEQLSAVLPSQPEDLPARTPSEAGRQEKVVAFSDNAVIGSDGPQPRALDSELNACGPSNELTRSLTLANDDDALLARHRETARAVLAAAAASGQLAALLEAPASPAAPVPESGRSADAPASPPPEEGMSLQSQVVRLAYESALQLGAQEEEPSLPPPVPTGAPPAPSEPPPQLPESAPAPKSSPPPLLPPVSSKQAPSKQTEELRKKAMISLTAAAENGTLGAAVGRAKAKQSAPPDQPQPDARDDGAKEVVKSRAGQDKVQQVREQVSTLLLNATADGRLDAALVKLGRQRSEEAPIEQSVAAPSADVLEETRQKTWQTLDAAKKNGRLEATLASLGPTLPEETGEAAAVEDDAPAELTAAAAVTEAQALEAQSETAAVVEAVADATAVDQAASKPPPSSATELAAAASAAAEAGHASAAGLIIAAAHAANDASSSRPSSAALVRPLSAAAIGAASVNPIAAAGLATTAAAAAEGSSPGVASELHRPSCVDRASAALVAAEAGEPSVAAAEAPAEQSGQTTAEFEDPELALAAVKIQAVHRGKKERQEVHQVRREKEEALKAVNPLAAASLDGSLPGKLATQAAVVEGDAPADPVAVAAVAQASSLEAPSDTVAVAAAPAAAAGATADAAAADEAEVADVPEEKQPKSTRMRTAAPGVLASHYQSADAMRTAMREAAAAEGDSAPEPLADSSEIPNPFGAPPGEALEPCPPPGTPPSALPTSVPTRPVTADAEAPASPAKNAEEIRHIHSAITELRTENTWLKDQLVTMLGKMDSLSRENATLSDSRPRLETLG